jgi:hypothetical protein
MNDINIPAALRARGWRVWIYVGEAHAVRLDGPADAPISATAHYNGELWCVYLERPPRRLRHPTPSLAESLARFEHAECQGLFSPLAWDNAPLLPFRRGWAHRVVDRQDQWVSVVEDPPIPLVVLTLPVSSRYDSGLRFAAFIGDEPIVHLRDAGEDGLKYDALTLFDDARTAMAAAEREAQDRAQLLGYPGRPTFVAPPIPSAFASEGLNV